MSSPRHAPPPPRFTLVHASLESGGVAASSVEPILAALARILALPASAPHYWLDVVGVRPDEMDRLADILSLHDVTVNDILYEDTQVSDEKFERFDDYLFVITDILNKAPDSDRWRTENCNVVVSRRGAACFRYTFNTGRIDLRDERLSAHCSPRRRSFEGGLGVDGRADRSDGRDDRRAAT